MTCAECGRRITPTAKRCRRCNMRAVLVRTASKGGRKTAALRRGQAAEARRSKSTEGGG